LITKVSEGTEEDVDIAVEAAQKAYETTWGLNAPGSVRTELLWKLAQLMERDALELAALEALDNGKFPLSVQIFTFLSNLCLGKTFNWARNVDVNFSISVIKYFAGWADKITGQSIEVSVAIYLFLRRQLIMANALCFD
jgi:aldehyde dehydrogenase (NAD+)